MSPKMPKEYFDFRTKQILMAAWECFVENGYNKTTIREIAKRMDISPGVIYNYFKKKDDIFEALHRWNVENNKQLFDQMNQKATFREAIKELFRAGFECCPFDELKKSARGNINFLSEALKREKLKEIYNADFTYAQEKISTLVRKGMESDSINTSLDSKIVARFYLALFTGLKLQFAFIEDQDISSHLEGIKKILLGNIWKDKKNNS